jgi:acetoin utilization deacetylase AcuC-like enzyme
MSKNKNPYSKGSLMHKGHEYDSHISELRREMKKIKVFYDDRQTAEGCESFSPSAGKPVKVVESWKALDLPIEITSFRPLTAEEIAVAHDRNYVDGVLNCTRSNGFGNTSENVAKSLPYTTGSVVAASLHALRTGETVISPTSGFHHAGWDHGGGFCTFEGLAIATINLLNNGAKKVGIIDLDAHAPQTMDILEKLGLESRVRHYAFGQNGIRPSNAEQWLEKLPAIVQSYADCNVILLNLGVDSHIEDPLGGSLTSKQMRRRDRIVFEVSKEIGVPGVALLAGGYQTPLRKVLDLHDAMVEEMVEVYVKNK